ncbi:sensor histidine kinase [Nonomuraea sp. SBT364]|uniref:sensor histidine kinase n=1 Tax=Nonomuraea sp. SBT364 TaxID=1580530 RepID=UPI00066A4F3E|nr:sensor histidine kinase [Nonomuraea sp. SBT364]
MLTRTALEALTRRPVAFLTSAWPWRSLAYLMAGQLPGVIVLFAAITGDLLPATPRLVGGAVVMVAALPLVAWLERERLRLVDEKPLGQVARGRQLGLAVLTVLALWWVDLLMILLTVVGPVLLILTPLVQPSVAPPAGAIASVAGVVLVPVAAYTMTAWAGGRGAMARALMAPLGSELDEVLRSRARLVDAFELERRRIERDLHDGAQQRLVALSMSLGLARLDLPDDSSVSRLVGQAQHEAKQALAELRELIRGVHPEVLTGRGLAAAVRDVAGRSPVPVEVVIDLDRRLSPAVEVTAYYVVSEALANVAKHSGASRARVTGHVRDGTLVIEVRDDGRGGADPARGTGLTGLADRLAVVDGRLSVRSPAGGPTLLRVEIPCAW